MKHVVMVVILDENVVDQKQIEIKKKKKKKKYEEAGKVERRRQMKQEKLKPGSLNHYMIPNSTKKMRKMMRTQKMNRKEW